MAKTNKASSEGKKLTLAVQPRTIFGKKLKKLRREGNVPANIYGQDFKSESVSAAFKDFTKVYKVARETGVVYLDLNKKELPVLIKNVQRHPVNDSLVHIDFRKIDLKQKIQTEVPVKTVGQSEAVSQKGGVLLTQSETLMIEALPTDIPPHIDVDISSLKELGQEIKVSDLAKSDKYEVKEEADKVVFSVVEHKEQEVLPQTTPAVAPEVLTAKPDEETAAGEKGTETSKPTEGKNEASQKEEKPAK